jgi:endonuclease-3
VTRTERARFTVDALRERIPEPETELHYRNEFELLVAVVLSAQCTDARVNQVTPALFEAYPTPQALARATPDQVFPFIRSVSYPNNKAKHLAGLGAMLVDEFGGQVPQTIPELIRLPGVGRKTALVVTSVAFGADEVAVDTHVFRVSNRIGLVPPSGDTPLKVERGLKRVLPREVWSEAHHLLILHGRYTCLARAPKCAVCPVAPACDYFARLQALPAPLADLDPKKGRYFAPTGGYFDRPDRVTDRYGVEQIAHPTTGSMTVFDTKTGNTTKRIRDFRV